jgi:hypothetical protein
MASSSKTKQPAPLAAALRTLKRLQDKHHGVVEHTDLSDAQRTLLVDMGFLAPAMKGWYFCGNPADRDGESTIWYATYWAFIARYLSKRFDKRYCLNPEASLLLHTGNATIPAQVVAVVKEGSTQAVKLPANTSLFVYPDEKRVPKSRVEVRGLQVWPVAEALCLVGPQYFVNNAAEAEIALSLVRSATEVLTTLLADGGKQAAASRLAGAFTFMKRPQEAKRILDSFAAADMPIKAVNPFEREEPSLAPSRERSPYVLRLQSMWARWRGAVIEAFPAPPGIGEDDSVYLAQVDERYVSDAYNSLSIEGYQVTDELIERVARGDWDPEGDPEHLKLKDTLAARGYYLTFEAVKKSIARLFSGDNAGDIADHDHHTWYAELFSPSVTAGILGAHQLAGYRTGPIFIRNSMHTPVPRDAILDCLEALFDLIRTEPHPAVRAVLGHHLFVFIHPYFDGNGRIGRFLMNVLLASGGYPWTVVRVKRRDEYMKALEQASVAGEIRPLAKFIAEEMAQWSAARE